MKQWVTGQDGLENLKLEDVAMPSKLQEDEVLVKVHCVSLNYRDTEVCMGLYGHHKAIEQGKKLVPCSDASGIIYKVGGPAAARLWKEGDRVMSIATLTHLKGQILEKDMASELGLPLDGVLAEYRIFPANAPIRIPEYLTDGGACTLPTAAVTAWTSMNWMQPIDQPLRGKQVSVLLQGTGGVAISGLQIAKALDMTTIVTSSSDAKLQRAKALGADHVINYKKTPNWDEEVLRVTAGQGVSIILETGGSQTLTKSFQCVAFGGMIACIGYLSGKEDSPDNRTNTNVLALARNVTLKGILNGGRDRFEEMCDYAYEQSKIRPVVDRVFDFGEARQALEYLYSGSHFGKVVVKVA